MAHDARFMSAATLPGDAVRNPQGESLGDLKEIMFDTSTGFDKDNWPNSADRTFSEQVSSYCTG